MCIWINIYLHMPNAVMLQPDYNSTSDQVEIVGDAEVNITMTATVPTGLCSDLSFYYDHPASGRVAKSDCIAYFRDYADENRLEHTLRLRVEPTPGCNSYTSRLEFKRYNKKVGESMWTGYVPNSITVRLHFEIISSLF